VDVVKDGEFNEDQAFEIPASERGRDPRSTPAPSGVKTQPGKELGGKTIKK